jgi:hypothetical protein
MVMQARFNFTKLLGRLTVGTAAAITSFSALPASADILRITEAMSSSGVGGTPDWFEVTNYGATPVTTTGFKMDDSSFNFAVAVDLVGISSIAPGESVIFIESAAGVGIPDFRTFWGGAASSAQVGYYAGSGVGFSSSGDGVVVFNSAGVAQTPQTSFGAATNGSSFYWAYDPTGAFNLGTQSNGLISTVGTIPGANGGISQLTYLSATALPQNIGSPGTAAVVPEPSTVGLAIAGGLGLAGLAARRRLRKA